MTLPQTSIETRMANYLKLSAGDNSAGQDAMPADEWLRQLDALVDSYDEERKRGTAAAQLRLRVAIKTHARRRVDLVAQQDASAAQAVPDEWEAFDAWAKKNLKLGGDFQSQRDIIICRDAFSAGRETGMAEHKAQQPASDEDLVLVPRGLIGAACSAISGKRDAPKVLAELRRYTFGDLLAPDDTPKGEPVAWEWRLRALPDGPWAQWGPGHAPSLRTDTYEVQERPLYTAPPDAAAIRNAALRQAFDICMHSDYLGDACNKIQDLITDQQEKPTCSKA